MGSLNQGITILILFYESGSYFMGKFHLIWDRNTGWIFTGGDGVRGKGLKQGWMVYEYDCVQVGKTTKVSHACIAPLDGYTFHFSCCSSSSPPWQGPMEPRRMWKLPHAPYSPEPKAICLNWSLHPIHCPLMLWEGSRALWKLLQFFFSFLITLVAWDSLLLKRVYFSFWKLYYKFTCYMFIRNLIFFCPTILFPKAVTQWENPLLLEINSIVLM